MLSIGFAIAAQEHPQPPHRDRQERGAHGFNMSRGGGGLRSSTTTNILQSEYRQIDRC